MALFGFKKKEKDLCPLCGSPLGFFNSQPLSDGNSICDKCAEKLGKSVSVSGLSLEEAKNAAASISAAADKLKERLGGNYQNIFTVEDGIFNISPKALDVGIARAKALNNKLVVEGTVACGSFKKGDDAMLCSGSGSRDVKILEIHKKDSGDFENELRANMSGKANEGDRAWFILDAESGVLLGDLIAK